MRGIHHAVVHRARRFARGRRPAPRAAFARYVPRHEGVVTSAFFGCYIEPSRLSDGHTVIVCGSWDRENVIQLHRDQKDPNVWTGSVNLPFVISEYSKDGIFEWRFGVRNLAGGVSFESSTKRLETTMEPTFFGQYGVTVPGAQYQFCTKRFLRVVARHYFDNRADFHTKHVLNCYLGIKRAFQPTVHDLMDIIDDIIQHLPQNTIGGHYDVGQLLFASMIGHCLVHQTAEMESIMPSMDAALESAGRFPRKLEDCAPSPWCQSAIDAAVRLGRQGWDVLFSVLRYRPPNPDQTANAADGAGDRTPLSHWAEASLTDGLTLAIARIRNAKPAYFEWLEITPLLRRGKGVHDNRSRSRRSAEIPRLEVNYATDHNTLLSFRTAVDRVFSLMEAHREHLMDQPKRGVADAAEGESHPVVWMPQHRDVRVADSDSVVWLRDLLKFAPHLSSVVDIVTRCYGHAHSNEGLVQHGELGASQWIASFPWIRPSQVESLIVALTNECGRLVSPNVAASVVRQASTDRMCETKHGWQVLHKLIHLCFQHAGATFHGPPVFAVCDWFIRRRGGPINISAPEALQTTTAALDEMNSLFGIPCFGNKPGILAGKMDFFRVTGDRRPTIALVARIAAHYQDMIASVVHPQLLQLMLRKTSTVVTDYFDNDPSPMRAQYIIGEFLRARPELQVLPDPEQSFTPNALHDVAKFLLFQRSRDGEFCLVESSRSLLPHKHFLSSDAWSHVLTFADSLVSMFEWHAVNKAALGSSKLFQLLSKAKCAIQQAAYEVKHSTVFVGTLRALLQQPTAALKVLDMVTKDYNVTTDDLEQAGSTLVKFDQQLEAVLFFFQSYCNDGDRAVYRVPTNVRSVKEGVQGVAQRLADDNYQLQEIKAGPTALVSALKRFPAVPELYRLRTSLLFRELWKVTGEYIQKWPRPPAEVRARGQDFICTLLKSIRPPGNQAVLQASSAKRSDGQTKPGQLWKAIAPAAVDSLKSELSTAALRWMDFVCLALHETDEAWTQGLSSCPGFGYSDPVKGLLDDEGRHISDTFEASQEPLDVVFIQFCWVPLALDRWSKFTSCVLRQTICMDALDATFGTLPEDGFRENCVNELACAVDLSEQRALQQQIEDFALVKLLLPRLNSIVDLFTALASDTKELKQSDITFDDGRIDNDVLVGEPKDAMIDILRSTFQRFSTEWRREYQPAHTLATVSELLDPVRNVAESLTGSQSAFLAYLGQSPMLVRWLRRYHNQDDFDKKLQVARGLGTITNPELVSGIESLKRVRVGLQPVLYVEQDGRHTSFQEFLMAFGDRVPVDTKMLADMKSLASIHDQLLDVLEKQTKGDGVRNCYELVKIHLGGSFVVIASQTESEVLRLRMPQQPDRDLSYLQDLRAKLMMTDISEELDQETATEPGVAAGVKVLLSAFAKHLDLLERMSQQVHSLCLAGHYAFQAGTEVSFPFNDVTDRARQDLEQIIRNNAAQLHSWKLVVDAVRNQCYLLNFYTMQELWSVRFHLTAVVKLHSAMSTELKDKDQKRTGRKYHSSVGMLKSLLHLVTSSTDAVDAAVVKLLKPESAALVQQVCGDVDPKEPFRTLEGLGTLLAQVLDLQQCTQKRELSPLTESVVNASRMLIPLQNNRSANKEGTLTQSPAASAPDVPIWVAASSDPQQPGLTLDMALSVFVRRQRLPEPGEILFCDASTTQEELSLLVRRFIRARENGRGDYIFCAVNVDRLPYAVQMQFVNTLKDAITSHGCLSASSLFIVSEFHDQHVINALSSYIVSAPPLQPHTLREKLSDFFGPNQRSRGTIRCVTSTINGGGKTHFILNKAAQAQQECKTQLKYYHFSLRENTTTKNLISLFRKNLKIPTVSSDGRPSHAHFIHIDIAHVVPRCVNTILFQLLLLNVLRDRHRGQVFHLDPMDSIYVELANSPSMVRLTRMCHVLAGFDRPLSVNAAAMQLTTPFLSGNISYKKNGERKGEMVDVKVAENDDLLYVCRTLKAFQLGAFKVREAAAPLNIQSIAVSPPECFRILCQYCQLHDPDATKSTGQPSDNDDEASGPVDVASWTIVTNFVRYLGTQLRRLNGNMAWANFEISMQQVVVPVLRNFRHQYILLLLETTRDFAKRVVPRGQQFMGAHAPVLSRTVSLNRQLSRQLSNNSTSSEQAAAAQRDRNEHDALAAELLSPAITVFERMKNWEDTDHPIAVLIPRKENPSRTQNLTIFALNREHTHRFIDREMFSSVEQVLSINLSRDWALISEREAKQTIEDLAGVLDILFANQSRVTGVKMRYETQQEMCTRCRVEKPEEAPPGYVMTVDNMAKMLSIFGRLQADLPVIIMGETGCGKSSLLRQMCALIRAPLRTLIIHGGMTDQDVLDWVWEQYKDFCQQQSRLDKFVKDLKKKYKSEGRRVPAVPVTIPYFVVFLDEVNTCDSMALFKELICDRTLQGISLPKNFKVIAACNPYRRRNSSAEAMKHLSVGLTSSTGASTDVTTGVAEDVEHIEMKDLVYRVFPLPESMMDHVYDFGALDADTEKLYVQPKLAKHLNFSLRVKSAKEIFLAEDAQRTRSQWAEMSDAERAPFEAVAEGARREATNRVSGFLQLFSQLVCASQEFVREQHNGERSAASLRDVDRCSLIFKWFATHLANEYGTEEGWTIADFWGLDPKVYSHVRTATIMSIAYCYHARLDRSVRAALRERLAGHRDSLMQKHLARVAEIEKRKVTSKTQSKASEIHEAELQNATWFELSAKTFERELEAMQTTFISHMRIGKGIARNEALCENLFMILLSVLNRIPIFVIGVPGSSKSLAMRLIQSNLRGHASSNEFLQKLPAVEVFPYQCSPQSTSHGIEQVFASAKRVATEAQNTVVVVLLDEVGLAEYSPHLPLKVLHKLLDDAHGCQALVGISNWPLDPAKMNRAVHLFRPAPTAADLAVTAAGIVEGEALRPHLKALARAFYDVVAQQRETYRNQSQADFWGLREYYSLVKKVNFDIKMLVASGQGADLDHQLLLNALQRNFGGRPRDMESVLQVFFEQLGQPQSLLELKRQPVLRLIRDNIGAMQESRHLMVLTKTNATVALSLLFDYKLLSHSRTEILFGSDFPADDSDLQIILHLQRVKKCMAEGRTVILVHSRDGFFETLYDLLNQNYTEHGGQLYARLAFGTSYVLCPLAKEFRVVVLVDQEAAYTRLAPPLLNRFEKQVLTRQSLIHDDQESMKITGAIRQLTAFVNSFVDVSFVSADAQPRVDARKVRAAFCGYHRDTLLSLAQSFCFGQEAGFDTTAALTAAIKRLLWCATPETASRWLLQNDAVQIASGQVEAEFGVNICEVYFNEQQHATLASFVTDFVLQRQEPPSKDHLASQTMVVTYAPVYQHTATLVTEQCRGVAASQIALHQLSSEQDLSGHIEHFYEDESGSETMTEGTDLQLLIVQCDPTTSSPQRVEHAKYIIEQHTAVCSRQPSAKNSVRKHVLLLVHMPRTYSAPLLPVDFNERWHVAFVDAIESAEESGLPDVRKLIAMKRGMHEIIALADMKRIFGSVFRTALMNLKMPFLTRTNFFELKIRQLQALVAMKRETEHSFLELITSTIQSIMKAQKLELSLQLSTESDILVRGTFQSCLNHQILCATRECLSAMLAHAERNSALDIIDPHTMQELPRRERVDLERVWYNLFRRSFPTMSISRPRGSHTWTLLDVQDDGLQPDVRFQSQFPFSFYVASLVEQQRPLFVPQLTTESLSTLEVSLHDRLYAIHHLNLSGDLENGSDALPKFLLQKYTYDFLFMQVFDNDYNNLDSASYAVAANFVDTTMNVLCGSSCRYASDIHLRWWKYSESISSHLRLLSLLPRHQETAFRNCLAAVVALGTGPVIVSVVDLTVLDCILQIMVLLVKDLPAAHWKQVFDSINDDVRGIFESCQSASEKHIQDLAARLSSIWQHLSLYGTFVTSFTLRTQGLFGEDGYSPNHALWTALSAGDTNIGSHAFFNELFEIANIAKSEVEPAQRSHVAAAFSQFMSEYLIHFAFATRFGCGPTPSNFEVEEQLIQDTIKFLSRDASLGSKISLAESSRLSLMRQFLDMDNPATITLVCESLSTEMSKSVSDSGFVDAPICVCYVYARENIIAASLRTEKKLQAALDAADRFERDSALLVDAHKRDQDFMQLLDVISLGRAVLDYFASLLCDGAFLSRNSFGVVDDDQGCGEPPHKRVCSEETTQQFGALLRKVNSCLVIPSHKTGTRLSLTNSYHQSLQLFFLKCVERRRGLNFLRGILRHQAFANAEWYKVFKTCSSVAHPHVQRWVSGSNMPTSNPLGTFPGAHKLTAAVEYTLRSGNADIGTNLTPVLKEMRDSGLGGYVPGALLIACFSSCYCLLEQPLSSVPTTILDQAQKLNKWLSDVGQASLQVDPVMTNMLRFFTNLSEVQNHTDNPLFLGPQSSTEEILHIRILVHITAIATIPLSDGHHNKCPLVDFFTSVLFRPARLKDSYFPQMPMDDLFYTMQSMVFASGRRGRWFYCRNGHPYCVDACGRPTQINDCSTCGVKIGGERHNQIAYIGSWTQGIDPESERPDGELQYDRDVDPTLQGNTSLFLSSTPLDQSKPLYCLKKGTEGTSDLSSASSSLRKVPARACCTQRLLLHAALLIGATFGGPSWLTHAESFMHPTESSKTLFTDLFKSRFILDADRLQTVLGLNAEDTELLVHAVLSNFVDNFSAVGDVPASAHLSTKEARVEWEVAVSRKIVMPVMGDGCTSHALEGLKKDCCDPNELRVTAMLVERNVDDISAQDRLLGAPLLFRYRQPFTRATFQFQCEMRREDFPLVHAFIMQPNDVAASHCLHHALEWMKLVTTKFDRRISENDASAISIESVLNNGTTHWHQAWQGFEEGWSFGLHLGKPILCGRTTPKEAALSVASSVSLCLPNGQNIGILPLALGTYLSASHNKVVDLVETHFNKYGRTSAIQTVSSSDFTHMHGSFKQKSSYNAALDDFCRFVELECIQYENTTGKLQFDCERAERWLVDTYFAEIARVEFDIQYFKYFGGDLVSDAYLMLRRHVSQQPLPADLEVDIGRDIVTKAGAHDCIEKLDQVCVQTAHYGGRQLRMCGPVLVILSISQSLNVYFCLFFVFCDAGACNHDRFHR